MIPFMDYLDNELRLAQKKQDNSMNTRDYFMYGNEVKNFKRVIKIEQANRREQDA